MIEAKFTIAMGNYQNVKVTISGENVADFGQQIHAFDDMLKSQVGVFHAELESWAVKAREDALNGVTDEAVENLSHLGVTVIEEKPVDLTVEELEYAAAAGPGDIQEKAQAMLNNPVRPWDRKPVVQPKAWEQPKKEEPKDDWDF